MRSTLDWTPPPGMTQPVITSWRDFYRKALATYGITPQQYRLLYVAQRGRCFICQKAKGVHPDDPKGRGYRRLGVDHNHVTGAVRGLLCTGGDNTCNRTIGWHDVPALLRAVEYLQYPPAMVLNRLEAAVEFASSMGTEMEPWQIDALAQYMLDDFGTRMRT